MPVTPAAVGVQILWALGGKAHEKLWEGCAGVAECLWNCGRRPWTVFGFLLKTPGDPAEHLCNSRGSPVDSL